MCSYTESVNLDGKGRYFFGSIGPSLLERNLHLNRLETFSVFYHQTFRTGCGLWVMGYLSR